VVFAFLIFFCTAWISSVTMFGVIMPSLAVFYTIFFKFHMVLFVLRQLPYFNILCNIWSSFNASHFSYRFSVHTIFIILLYDVFFFFAFSWLCNSDRELRRSDLKLLFYHFLAVRSL
jgi:hypothetical protein